MAEDTQVQKFDPSALMQGVRDRIKATFVSLIPDAQWEQLTQKEIDDFFKPRDDYRSQRDWRSMSDFQKICFEEFEKLVREKIHEMLQEYTSSNWSDNGPKMSEELKKLLVENSDKIFAQMLGSMFQSAVNGMKNY